MTREMMMVAGVLIHAKIQRTGSLPSDADIDQSLDCAERIAKKCMAREEKWRKMEDDHFEAKRKASIGIKEQP